MKDQKHETAKEPAAVTMATSPKQAGEARDRWWWVEHEVWTTRMLTRLAASGPATKWFALWDKVYGERNLLHAYYAVWRNGGAAGADGQTVEQFEARHQQELKELGEELRGGKYRAQPAWRVWIEKPGSPELRPLGVPAVRDRVVQGALRQVIEPIFEQDFAENSYGFRPGRSCQQAVSKVEEHLAGGNIWCVDADLKSYFDTISHERLWKRIEQRIADGKVLELIRQYLKAGVMEGVKGWQPSQQGTPQGAVISPLLANIYLNPLDHEMERQGWKMVRYADDFVVLCASQEEAQRVLAYVQEWTQAEGLTLHPAKTRIVNAWHEGFDFLGWTFRRGQKWPRKKSLLRLREKLRPWTKRTQGLCLNAIIQKVNPILRGWHGYYKASIPTGLSGPDGWLRRRFRAMLLKRLKQPDYGISKNASRRWPNGWFANQGLFSLEHGSCVYR